MWSLRRPPWRCCQTRLLMVGSARPLRLGTRGSRLALVQSEIVAARLRAGGAPGEAEALVLAAAGLDRLGLGGRIATRIDGESMPPAPAQGALAIQARRDDAEVLDVLGRLDDADVRLAVVAERALLKAMGGGCRAPVGAVAVRLDGVLTMLAGAVTHDGRSQHLVRLLQDIQNGGSLAPG